MAKKIENMTDNELLAELIRRHPVGEQPRREVMHQVQQSVVEIAPGQFAVIALPEDGQRLLTVWE